jgi:hypothetical protein
MMSPNHSLTQEEQAALTLRLREWIQQEVDRGIPMSNILIACEECGLLGLMTDMDDPEIPEVND